jgi:hypothetical protein
MAKKKPCSNNKKCCKKTCSNKKSCETKSETQKRCGETLPEPKSEVIEVESKTNWFFNSIKKLFGS